MEDANADVARMIPLVAETFPPFPGAPRAAVEENRTGPSVRLLKDRIVGDLDEVLFVLMGTIGMLLLIACANIANLLLVRTEVRRQELAIRAALGAGWGAIARSLLLESAVLALLGGAAGLLLASAALPALLRLAGSALPSALVIGIDLNVVLFTLGVSLLCGALLCLIPIAKHAAPRVVEALRGAARSYSAGRESHRARNTLVVLQVALALVLLIGSGLMIRSFAALRAVDAAVQDPAQVQTLRVWIPPASVREFPRVVRMQNDIADRIAALPGVESVAYASRRPLLGDGPSGPFVFDNAPEPAETEFRYASPGFFATLGTPLLAGRDFEWADTYENRPSRNRVGEHRDRAVGLPGCGARPYARPQRSGAPVHDHRRRRRHPPSRRRPARAGSRVPDASRGRRAVREPYDVLLRAQRAHRHAGIRRRVASSRLGRQPRSSARLRRAARRAVRALDGAQVADARAARDHVGHGPVARAHRHLRSHRLRAHAAHARNRHPHGARRARRAR